MQLMRSQHLLLDVDNSNKTHSNRVIPFWYRGGNTNALIIYVEMIYSVQNVLLEWPLQYPISPGISVTEIAINNEK